MSKLSVERQTACGVRAEDLRRRKMRPGVAGALVAVAFIAVVALQACVERFGADCAQRRSCSEHNIGGMPGSGGSSSGGTGATTGAGASSSCSDDCGGSAPHCLLAEDRCVECLGEEDCGGRRCDLETHSCVDCFDSGDCKDPALPRCEAQACVGCQDEDDCTRFERENICDGSGACVQCTVEEEEVCGGTSCDPVDKTCTENELGKTGRCMPCLADSECIEDHRCVPMKYMGEHHGHYCMPLPPAMGGCNGHDAPWRTFLNDRVSRSGAESATYCGINEDLTTCDAVIAAIEDTIDCASDESACPVGGLCAFVGPDGAGWHRCTYRCGAANQCPGTLDPNLATCPKDPPTPTAYCGQVP